MTRHKRIRINDLNWDHLSFVSFFSFVLSELNSSDKKYTHHEYTCFYNWWEMSNTQNDVDQLLHPPQASLTTAKACVAGVAAGVAVSSKSKSVIKKNFSQFGHGDEIFWHWRDHTKCCRGVFIFFRILFDSTRTVFQGHTDSGSCTCTMALEDSPSLGSVSV